MTSEGTFIQVNFEKPQLKKLEKTKLSKIAGIFCGGLSEASENSNTFSFYNWSKNSDFNIFYSDNTYDIINDQIHTGPYGSLNYFVFKEKLVSKHKKPVYSLVCFWSTELEKEDYWTEMISHIPFLFSMLELEKRRYSVKYNKKDKTMIIKKENYYILAKASLI